MTISYNENRAKTLQTRQKVLIAAFTRSLKDPFVHGRNASLQALAATSDIFSEEDGANRILPAICCSLVDREKCVINLYPSYIVANAHQNCSRSSEQDIRCLPESDTQVWHHSPRNSASPT